MKQRKPPPPRLRAKLQQEINSECPFCANTDVANFHVHHIDSDPSNSVPLNLIMLCPNCHSKITHRDISKQEVVEMKNHLLGAAKLVEFVSVKVKESACNWRVSDKSDFAFYEQEKKRSPFPIFEFILTNHSNQNTVLTDIMLQATFLPAGLSGLGPEPRLLKSLTRYHISINHSLKINHPISFDEIDIPAKMSVKFEVELSERFKEKVMPFDQRVVLFFAFKVGKNIVRPPMMFLNCEHEDPRFTIVTYA